MVAAAAAIATAPTISATSLSSSSSLSPRTSLLFGSPSKLPKPTSSARICCQLAQQAAAAAVIPREQRWMFEESEINGPDIWNRTWYPKASDHVTTEKTWYVVDATDKILGRLASTIAIHTSGGRILLRTPLASTWAPTLLCLEELYLPTSRYMTGQITPTRLSNLFPFL